MIFGKKKPRLEITPESKKELWTIDPEDLEAQANEAWQSQRDLMRHGEQERTKGSAAQLLANLQSLGLRITGPITPVYRVGKLKFFMMPAPTNYAISQTVFALETTCDRCGGRAAFTVIDLASIGEFLAGFRPASGWTTLFHEHRLDNGYEYWDMRCPKAAEDQLRDQLASHEGRVALAKQILEGR